VLRRILSISLIQASKGVALTLFPSIFITLLAWATAGSTSGNTSDPIRGAIWLWLGLHLGPFHLASTSAQGAGYLSILPLGGILFPIWAVRRTFPRVIEEYSENARKVRAARVFYTTIYTTATIILALLTASNSVSPMWYYAGLCAGITALVSTLKFNLRPSLAIAIYIFAIAWGVVTIILGFSMLAHWRVMNDLSIVIAPGIIGGVLFTFAQILYIPNAALAGLAYLTGSGFSVGAHTMVSASTFTLNQLPAIPLFGALPTGSHPLLFGGVIFWPLLIRTKSDWHERQREVLRTFIMAVFFVWELTYFASGELLTPSMKRTGVLPERTTSIAAMSAAAVAIAFFYIPKLFSVIQERRNV
jgi:hypothetical protein